MIKSCKFCCKVFIELRSLWRFLLKNFVFMVCLQFLCWIILWLVFHIYSYPSVDNDFWWKLILTFLIFSSVFCLSECFLAFLSFDKMSLFLYFFVDEAVYLYSVEAYFHCQISTMKFFCDKSSRLRAFNSFHQKALSQLQGLNTPLFRSFNLDTDGLVISVLFSGAYICLAASDLQINWLVSIWGQQWHLMD